MNKKYYKELLDKFMSTKSRAEMEDFLVGLLTPGELEQMTKRLQIVKRLKKGVRHREIADDLEVGIATVTRGSRELNRGRFRNIN